MEISAGEDRMPFIKHRLGFKNMFMARGKNEGDDLACLWDDSISVRIMTQNPNGIWRNIFLI